MTQRPVLLAAAALLLASCASTRPVVYPNEKLRQTGGATLQADIDECMAEAREYVKTGRVKEVAKSTAEGAVVGGAVGAATGAVLGEGRGAAAGAAGGAAGAFARGILGSRDPDPVEKAYVNRCLAKRGYEVLGWR
jgi:uncharacterized protein YcfJ